MKLKNPPEEKILQYANKHFIEEFICTENMFVRTKMRPKEGTKIELHREICQIC